MAKITKAQAEALFDKQVAPLVRPGVALIDKAQPRLEKLAKQMRDELKLAESHEQIDVLIKAMRLQMRDVAEGLTKVGAGLKAIKTLTDDEGVMAALGPDITKDMKYATGYVEKARNLLRDAKTLLDEAEKAQESIASDNDAAGEDWAAAAMNVERVTTGALAEAPAWSQWMKDARAAAEARDKAKLDKLKKAKPAGKLLAEIAALPKDKPFADFDSTYALDKLSRELQAEIKRDRAKLTEAYKKAWLLALERKAMEAEVDRLAIEPRDIVKALKVLALPATVKGKLQLVLDGPDAALAKGLEAIAKSLKMPAKGSEMVAALKKAAVL